MAAPLDPQAVRALLLDIEGTTTPPAFVYERLFPYARKALRDFLRHSAASPAVLADLEGLRFQHMVDAAQALKPPPWQDGSADARLASAASYVDWLMDRDSKVTALKSLQGKIVEAGYQSGELRGEVYPDVPQALARWSEKGKAVAIFSSGSVRAQQLLFQHSTAGDLSRHVCAYFDTTTGAKREAQSYRRIAEALAVPPAQVLFLSDVVAELDAARAAGCLTALCLRSTKGPTDCEHPIVRSFDEVFPA